MECKHIVEKIDQFIFEDEKYLDSDLLSHIESCVSCKLYYENAIQTKNTFRSIRDSQPVLKNPEKFTEEILRNLDNPQSEDLYQTNKNVSHVPVLVLFQRLLVAASILLLVVFSIEQYVVVDKILKLEQKMSTVPKNSKTILNINTLIRANPKQAYDFFKKKFDLDGSKGKQSKFSFLINYTRLSYAEMQNINTKKQNPSRIDKIKKSKTPIPFQKD